MSLQQVTDATFDKEVNHSDVPVLVDFWADWCGPCKMITPVLEDFSNDVSGKLKIVKVNVDENQQTASEFGVRSIPTLLLIKKGEVVSTKMGFMPKPKLKDWVSTTLNID